MTDSVAVFAPGFRVLDANGDPVSGAKLKFYNAGTTDPKTVYSNSGLSTSLGSTVHCDSGGYPVSTEGGSTKVQVYLGTADYKLIITDSEDVTIASHDNIKGAVTGADLTGGFAKSIEPVVSVTSSRSITSSDYGKFIKANSTAGSITLTLPTAATAGDGTRVRVKHVGSAGTISIAASGTDQIEGVTGTSDTYQLSTYGNEVLLISNGAGWEAIALVIQDGTITGPMLSSSISGTFVQTGTIIAWPHSSTPSGYLECDGSAVSRSTYADLFAVISDDYGNGDGSTTFNLPDYRGYFLRGLSGSSSTDPDKASRTDRGDGTTGNSVGTKQATATAAHTHSAGTLAASTASGGAHTHTVTAVPDIDALGATGGSGRHAELATSITTSSSGSHTHTITMSGATASTGGNESRPPNVYVRYLIFAGASVASGASSTFHTLLHGSGAPNDDLGNNDDFYIDVDTWEIYGPKAGGSWTGTQYQLGFGWEGTWTTATAYAVNDVVENGAAYICTVAHTSGASTEPGVGASWATNWDLFVDQGPAGATGAAGSNGTNGTDPGLLYKFSTTTTDSDPGAGYLRANNANLSSATAIYIDDVDRNANNHEASILKWDDATNTVTRGKLLITTPSNGVQVIFDITGNSTDASGYVKLSVTYSSGATSFANDANLSVQFVPAGNDGAGAVDSVNGQTGPVVLDATDITLLYPAKGVLAPHENLKIANDATNPNYQVDITADAVVLATTDGAHYVATSVSETADIATSGVNGLDTGTEANSTWYYIWLIYNGSAVNALLSTSATAPTMPGGYTYKALVGAIYNDSSGHFHTMYQKNRYVTQEVQTLVTGGTATTATSLSLATSMPPNATAAMVQINLNNTSGVARVVTIMVDSAGVVGSGAAYAATTTSAMVPTVVYETQTLYYKISSATSASADVYCRGWIF